MQSALCLSDEISWNNIWPGWDMEGWHLHPKDYVLILFVHPWELWVHPERSEVYVRASEALSPPPNGVRSYENALN